jgi:CRISPR-associated protein (TIGR03986 family)
MAVTAPFQFARIPRAVWFPAWGNLVSHDVPFADGYSGTIDIEIEAMTPLLIGGERRKGSDNAAGEVWPVKLPGTAGAPDRYAIPGSSLQGMIRNILEIACFGKLGPWVDQRRFGIRDISGTPTGVAAYSSRMTELSGNVILNKVKAGWLMHTPDGQNIIPCELARIHIDDIVALSGAAGHAKTQLGDDLTARKGAKERYNAYLDCGTNPLLDVMVAIDPAADHPQSDGHLNRHARCASGGTIPGTLVLTGKPQTGVGAGQKKRDFVFHSPDRLSAKDPGTTTSLAISEDVWRDFEAIHEAQPGRKINANWDCWKGDFEDNRVVPVFYLVDPDDAQKVTTFGTAFMFKLAHRNDTHDMLENSSKDHLNTSKYDLASLIFGGVGGQRLSHSLKRRASFDWANATLPAGKTGPDPKKTTVLLGPKPSYYPIYVRQPTTVGGLYASYTPAKRRANNNQDVGDIALARYHPEISGAKVWPSPTDGSVTMDRLPGGAGANVDVTLNALPAGTTFTTTLHVHNLRKVELGALLWALTLGDEAALTGGKSALRHRIGMGKPYGLGSVAMKVKSAEITPNAAAEVDLAAIMAAFVCHMNGLLETLGRETNPPRALIWVGANPPAEKHWVDTLQVRGLIEVGTPRAANDHPTTYMPLNNDNGYIERRKASEALLPLAPQGWEFSRMEDAAAVPQVTGQPAQNRGGQGGGGNRDNNRGGGQGQARRNPQAARTYRAEVGCPVEHNDGRIGEISKIEFGLCHIRNEAGEINEWPANSFRVTGPPDL